MNDNSFSLMMVSIVLGGLLLGGSCFYQMATADDRRGNAETEARHYAQTMFPGETPVVVSCQAEDTDNNGYVTCSLRVGERPIFPIECAAYVMFSTNQGCKPVRYMTPPSQ